MKRFVIFITFILSIALMSCSEDRRNEQEVSEMNDNSFENQQSEDAISSSGDAFERRIQEGDIILLYNESEPAAAKPDEDEVNTVTLPDGKMYEVQKNDDMTLLKIPGKEPMQIIELNDKFYLFDDDNQAYEIKYENNKLYAEATTLTDELLKDHK